MSEAFPKAAKLLGKSLESGRIHSAYLISGAGSEPLRTALHFARGLVCRGDDPADRPCEGCRDCLRSRPLEEPVALDGQGKQGPFYSHIGEHPDLLFLARGASDTRVRIDQIRAVQSGLRRGANEGGWRVLVVADAEMLNAQAQNALLKLLEEPPDRACVILVPTSASTLLPTIRSRSVRIVFPSEQRPILRGEDAPEEVAALTARFDDMRALGLPELLDWAEEYRGNRATAAEKVQTLLDVGGEWLRDHIAQRVASGEHGVDRELSAFRTLLHARRDLVQRNANPQMIAERSLFAVREALPR
jgi:DNA polymerase III delta prime subunit